MWTSSGVKTLQCSTSATLAAMLEKEMSYYRRYPPNKVVPLAEYIQHRRMLVEWCNTIVDRGSFRAPNELVQVVSFCPYTLLSVLTSIDLSFKLTPKAMALADKYMSMAGLYSYMKAHYQLIVVTCLSIAIKVDSPSIVVTCQELSELCRGEYTREEIESEEICVLHALAWYVNPPTASQIANHILALVENLKSTQSEWDWAVFLDRVHRLVKASVLDLGLSTQLRPSTLALASILVSSESLRDTQCRQGVLRSILTIMNKFDFASPSEIDTVRTDLTFLLRPYNTSPSSFHQPQQAPVVQSASVLSASNPVLGSEIPPNPSSQVAGDIPSNLYCVDVYCADVNSPSQRADAMSSHPPRQRKRAGPIGPTTYRRAGPSSSAGAKIGPTTYRRADSSSSESSAGSSSDASTQSSGEQHYLPLRPLKKAEERRLRMSSLSFHSSSTTTILDTIPEFVEVDDDDGKEEESSGGVSALTHRSSPVRAASLRRQSHRHSLAY